MHAGRVPDCPQSSRLRGREAQTEAKRGAEPSPSACGANRSVGQNASQFLAARPWTRCSAPPAEQRQKARHGPSLGIVDPECRSPAAKGRKEHIGAESEKTSTRTISNRLVLLPETWFCAPCAHSWPCHFGVRAKSGRLLARTLHLEGRLLLKGRLDLLRLAPGGYFRNAS